MRLEVPIIFLTARDTENDLLTGFNLGADDYITKPFSVRALQARIKAVLKRIKATPSEEITTSLNVGEIVIDFESKRLIIGDKKIELTRKEYEIICLLENRLAEYFHVRRSSAEYGKAMLSSSIAQWMSI